MKPDKVCRVVINVILICAMVVHCVLNVIKLASDASNSAPAWIGGWVCLIYIVVIILVNAVFPVFQKDKEKE